MDYHSYFIFITSVGLFSKSLAITNLRRFEEVNFFTSDEPITEWENGLREATYHVLQRHYKNPNLRHYLKSAPILGHQNQVTPFGDIAVLARGQLYFSHRGFLFAQDPYQNDCEECHNAAPPCHQAECRPWRPVNNEKLIALWTVKRIRHRDPNGTFRYELKYTISPLNGSLYAAIVKADGNFDYNIPGHVFILRSTHHASYGRERFPLSIFKPNPPAPSNHQYLPDTPTHFPPSHVTFGKHRFQQPERTRPINQIDETPTAEEASTDRQVSNKVTTIPKTGEQIYKELLDILQQKTSTHSSVQGATTFEELPSLQSSVPQGKPTLAYTTSSTFATHIKQMQEMISGRQPKPKQTTPNHKPPMISKEYSKTTMYSFTDSTFTNPPPTTTAPPKLFSAKTKPLVKISTRLRADTNQLVTSPKYTKKTSSITPYFKAKQTRKKPAITTTTFKSPSTELEIIPITNQSALLTPILNLLRPIMEIMKTENPMTDRYEFETKKELTTTTTELSKPSPKITTPINNFPPTIVEIQKSETRLETVNDISPKTTTLTKINQQVQTLKPSTTVFTNPQTFPGETITLTSTSTTPASPSTKTDEILDTDKTTLTTKSSSKITSTKSPKKSTKNTTTPALTVANQFDTTVSLSKETIIELEQTNGTGENVSSSLFDYQSTITSPPQQHSTPYLQLNPKTESTTSTKGATKSPDFADELFGSTTTTKSPVKTETIEKLGESNETILDELFGHTVKSKPTRIENRMDFEISSENPEETNDVLQEPKPKIIFSNFYFAPTQNPEENPTLTEHEEEHLHTMLGEESKKVKSNMSIEKLNMMAHYTTQEDQEEIPTSQSVSTSVSFVVNKPNNRTQTEKKNREPLEMATKQSKPIATTLVKAMVKEVNTKHNGYVVYKAEFPDQKNKENQKIMEGDNYIEASGSNLSSLLNNITLSVVNNARAIHFLTMEKLENTTTNTNAKRSKTKGKP